MMPKVYYEVIVLDVTRRVMHVSTDEELSGEELIHRIRMGDMKDEDVLIEAVDQNAAELDGYYQWDTATRVEASETDSLVDIPHLEFDDPGPLCGDAGQIDDCIKPFGHMDECRPGYNG